ncbi:MULTISPECIES: hypothetical protein [Leptolyngbya]|uniref:hypothetical protein n=1 Tax=Leptolyngbya TaxID=47251 RepID=UPI0018F02847|nr:hypothetical protein [Leptolyngbya sp. FACHB-1624]
MRVAQTAKDTNSRSLAWGHTLVRETMAGTNVKHTSLDEQLEFSALIPVLPEPRAITTVLFDIDAGSAAIAACLAKTQAIAQSMMHELLTGKMRLL